ncbi:hypothetical protein [Amycolatopsis sp. cg9]|uniref:hypothetical protein n=1 Tax=Amycolatopsis sp. cg9 TaxID=3238801 RepID=UPI0035258B9F
MNYTLAHLEAPSTSGLDQYDCWQRAEEAQHLAIALREQAAEYRAACSPGLHTTIIILGELAARLQERAHRFREAAEVLDGRS